MNPHLSKKYQEILIKANQPKINIWRAIKINKSFSARDICVSATTPETPITLQMATRYLNFLVRAKYLVKNQQQYQLKPNMNTGKYPPMPAGKRGFYDPNTRILTGWLRIN